MFMFPLISFSILFFIGSAPLNLALYITIGVTILVYFSIFVAYLNWPVTIKISSKGLKFKYRRFKEKVIPWAQIMDIIIESKQSKWIYYKKITKQILLQI